MAVCVHFVDGLGLERMKRKLYEILVPRSVKTRIYRMHHELFVAEQAKTRRAIHESIPESELGSIYIANLQIVMNRNELFQRMPCNGIVAELGAGQGHVSNRILAITRPRKLYLLDSWLDHGNGAMTVIESRFSGEASTDQVSILPGDALCEFEKFDDHLFDWVYLNTDCSFDSTVRALAAAKHKVKARGIIAGANYTTGSWLNDERYAVIPAVHTFCKENRFELIYLTHESHRQLSYALRQMN